MSLESMTGYAVASAVFPGGSLQLELKGVNARFLDLHLKVADDLRQYETLLRENLTARITRGKVECRLYYTLDQDQGSDPRINENALLGVVSLQAALLARLPEAAPLSSGEILRWPGMLIQQAVDFAALAEPVGTTLRLALDDFIASRQREGTKLAAMIEQRVVAMRSRIQAVEPLIPLAQTAYADKLRQKMLDMMESADENRICQEVAVYATRIDVAEEISRLTTHLDEVQRVLDKGGMVGKRLDFLMQELNREANTLGSKSVISEVSQAAMELKLLVEQMREQVQNLA